MKKESFELENHSFQCGEIEIFRFSFQKLILNYMSYDLNIRNAHVRHHAAKLSIDLWRSGVNRL